MQHLMKLQREVEGYSRLCDDDSPAYFPGTTNFNKEVRAVSKKDNLSKKKPKTEKQKKEKHLEKKPRRQGSS